MKLFTPHNMMPRTHNLGGNSAAGLFPLVAAVCLLGTASQAKEVITGLRTWRFTDGSELRGGLRSVKDGSAILGTSGPKPPIPFEKFIPEHRKILEQVANGEVELLDDPRSGVQNTISIGDGGTDQVLRYSIIGRERVWTRKDGKTAKGRLVNITDDEIHLLIGGDIWKMMVADMDAADLAYLDGINRGTEQAFPARLDVSFSLPAPDGKQGYTALWIDGARFMDSKPGLNFEGALAKAKAEISSKMAATAWSLREVKEEKIGPIEYHEKRMAGYSAGNGRSCYAITFTISGSKVADARRHFPVNIDGTGACTFIYFDDGLPPESNFQPVGTK
jgi:hypothetical protein